MIIKMLKADNVSRRVFDSVKAVGISGSSGRYTLCMTKEDGSTVEVAIEGQVFLMNDQGVTVDRFVPGEGRR